MRARGKSLTFEEEELEDLVESKDRAFALLSVLYPFVDTKNNKFHIDHVFPKSRFSSRRLRRAGVPEDDIVEYQDRVDRLPNLQLLVGDLNQSKSDMLPGKWIATFDARAAREYAEHHDLGDVPAAVTEFNVFYEARRDRLLSRLRRLVGSFRANRAEVILIESVSDSVGVSVVATLGSSPPVARSSAAAAVWGPSATER